MPDDCTGQNETAQSTSPKSLRIGDKVGRCALRDRNFREASSLQQPKEFARVGETKHIVALRHVRRHRYANLGNGFTEDALDSLTRRIMPPTLTALGERQHMSGSGASRHFVRLQNLVAIGP